MDARLLVIAAAVAIAVIGARLERRQQSPTTTGFGSGGYASQERIGARNHSGAEPYDLFGLRQRGW